MFLIKTYKSNWNYTSEKLQNRIEILKKKIVSGWKDLLDKRSLSNNYLMNLKINVFFDYEWYFTSKNIVLFRIAFLTRR